MDGVNITKDWDEERELRKDERPERHVNYRVVESDREGEVGESIDIRQSSFGNWYAEIQFEDGTTLWKRVQDIAPA